MDRLTGNYAEALLELALEDGALEERLSQAIYIKSVMQSFDSDKILKHPHVPEAVKKQLFEDLFSDKISEELKGFLHFAVDKGKGILIIPALEEFIGLAKKRTGTVIANVVSAAPLSAGRLERLKAVLENKLHRKIEISHKVDPDLIGGLYIRVDGRLIDYTVRTQLYQLKQSM